MVQCLYEGIRNNLKKFVVFSLNLRNTKVKFANIFNLRFVQRQKSLLGRSFIFLIGNHDSDVIE